MQRLPFQFEAAISKVDADNQLIYSTLLAPESRDLQKDIISLPEIRKAAHYFMEQSQVVGEMHTREAKAQTLESWVDDAGWHTATKINDPAIWQKIEDGTYGGMSIGGFATAVEDGDGARLSNLEVDEYSIVTRPAVPEAKLRRSKAESIVLYKSQRLEDDETLAEKIRSGKVKRRVNVIREWIEQGKAFLAKFEAADGSDSEYTEDDMERLDKLEAEFAELRATIADLSENVAKALTVVESKSDDAAGTEDVKAQVDIAEQMKTLAANQAELAEMVKGLAGKVAPAVRQKTDGEAGAVQPGAFETSEPLRNKAYGSK